MPRITRASRFGVLALASALLLGGSVTAASAVSDEGTPVSFITQDTGSLTIHKHKQGAALGTAGNGLELQTAPADPLQGVKFKVEKVANVDLKTNEGWKNAEAIAKAYKAGTAPAIDNTFTARNVVTGADGTVTVADLPVGYYLVTETDNTGAKDADGNAVKGLVGVKPFLVSIPMTHPTNLNSWVYDVHVYPKNQPVSITKAVTDKSKNVGDVIKYEITADVPHVEEGKDLSKYVITDSLPDGSGDKGSLSYVSTPVAATVTFKNATSTYTAGTDYNIATESHKVKVTFTAAGLKKLASDRRANVNFQVVLTFYAQVDAVNADGNVVNIAYLAPSSEFSDEPNPDEPNNPDNPPGTPPVITKFGKAKFIKLASDKDAPNNKLAGAEFQLYLCEELDDEEASVKTPLSVNGVEFWVSDSNGAFEIVGLHASDWIDGKSDTTTYTATNPQYCLLESKAPSGYELLPEPIRFNVPAGQGYNAEIAYNAIEVKNYPKNGGFDLPLTGSNALILVSIVGLAAVAGGVFFFLRSRREEEAEA